MAPVVGSIRPRAASTRAILRELDPSSFKASAHQEDQSMNTLNGHFYGREHEFRNSNIGLPNGNTNGHHDALLPLTHTPTNASTDSSSTGTSTSSGSRTTNTSIPSITISSSSDSAGGHHHHHHHPHPHPQQPQSNPDQILPQLSSSSSVSLPEDVRNEHREVIQPEGQAQAKARQQSATQANRANSPSSSIFPTPVRPTGPLSRAVASVGPGANTANTVASMPTATPATTPANIRVTGTIPTVDQCTIRPERVNPILRLTRKHAPAESAAAHHEPVQRSPLSNRPSRSSSKSSVADRHLQNSSPSKTQAMALKFLTAHSGSSGTSSSVKYFDIRLANDYIVFRGNEDESSSAELSGSLVLCLTDI